MQFFFLKQPDGKIAYYHGIQRNFDYYNLTVEEAYAFTAGDEWDPRYAKKEIDAALADEPMEEGGVDSGDGLNRWRAALVIVARDVGIRGVRKLISDAGFPDADIPQKAFDEAYVPGDIGRRFG